MNECSQRTAFYDVLTANEAMQRKVSLHHLGLYTWICELSSRVGRDTVDLPRDYTMQMSLIGSPGKLAACIEDLAHWGFLEIISKGNKWSGATRVRLQCSFLNTEQTLSVQRANIERTESVQRIDINSVCTSNTISDSNISNTTDIAIPTTHTREEKLNPEAKISVRPFVLLTDKEKDAVVTKYGHKVADLIFDKLDAYKLSTGKKYASDYGAINSWVAGKVLEDQQRTSNSWHATSNRPAPVVADDAQPFGPPASAELVAQRQQRQPTKRDLQPSF